MNTEGWINLKAFKGSPLPQHEILNYIRPSQLVHLRRHLHSHPLREVVHWGLVLRKVVHPSPELAH